MGYTSKRALRDLIRKPTKFDPEKVNAEEELRNPGYVFPEVETTSFIENLLPPLREGINVKRVRYILGKKGFVGFGGQRKGLWTTSGGKRRKKRDTFAPFIDIFERATSAAAARSPNSDRVMDMVLLSAQKGHENLKQGVVSRDACFIHKDRKPTSSSPPKAQSVNSWDDIALTVSFRRVSNDETRKENARKIVSNIQLALARDPCRRFTFGITVENTNMRLWFCSRASPVVSKPFDFSKNLDLLIHVFLSLAFATKEELGWDPTIQPFIVDDGRRVYHVDVDGEIYETRQALSKSSADQLTGHATRVWIAYRRGSDVPYVLKDVWTEDDERPEHSVHGMILHDVEAKYGPDIRQEVASHLLTPVSHCLVQVNGEEDDTTGVMMRGYIPSFKEQYRVNVENLGGSSDDDDDDEVAPPSTEIRIEGLGRGNLRDPLHWYNPVRKIRRRRHYRVVFKEVAKPVYAIRKLADVFTVLSDSAKVLKWIHGAGWVHRDLSVGNLYLYQGRGLIGDLEYARRKNLEAENEARIGTPDSIAVEVEMRGYLYLPQPSEDDLNAKSAAVSEGRREDVKRMMNSELPPPFSYNDLHDLESLWWIAVRELFDNGSFGEISGRSDAREHDVQRESASAKLFSGSSVMDRLQFMRATDVYYNEVAWMPERLHSTKITLDSIRIELLLGYQKFEATFRTDQTQLLEGVHDELQKQFAKCIDSCCDEDPVTCSDLALQSRKDSAISVSPVHVEQPALQDQDDGRNVASVPKEKELTIGAGHVCDPSTRGVKRKRDGDEELEVLLRVVPTPIHDTWG